MSDEQQDYEKRFEAIQKGHTKTHHLCKCRECDPITSMSDRALAFETATALLSKKAWHEDDQPSVRETMGLADWLMYGPEATTG